MVEEEALSEPQEQDEFGTRSKVSLLDQHSELKKKAEGEWAINVCWLMASYHKLHVYVHNYICTEFSCAYYSTCI